MKPEPLKRNSRSADQLVELGGAMSNEIDGDPAGHALVKRWRRFGLDRLYVNEGDGRAIGWFDLRTGERVIESPVLAQLFERTIEEWMRRES
jgi:hypothetical protein